MSVVTRAMCDRALLYAKTSNYWDVCKINRDVSRMLTFYSPHFYINAKLKKAYFLFSNILYPCYHQSSISHSKFSDKLLTKSGMNLA